MIVVGVAGLSTFLFLACCFCFKIRKGLSDDTEDSVIDSDAYQTRTSAHNTNGFVSGKKLIQANSKYSAGNKMIKGVKGKYSHENRKIIFLKGYIFYK